MSFKLIYPKIYLLISILFIVLFSGCQEGGSVTGSSDLSEDGFGSIAGKLVIDKGIVSDTGQFVSLGGSVIPASEVSVRLMSTNAEVKSDSLGNYLFEKVPEGKHSLVADAGEYKVYIQDIQVRTGQVSKNITGTLAVCGTIKGTVRLAGQSDHDRIEVTLPYNNKIFYTNVTGNYQYDNLPAGSFTVIFSKYGYETYEKTVTLDPGKTLRMDDIILFPSGNEVLASDFTGSLEKDSIMTKEKSPYRPTGDITVPHGVELVIEPGVEIIFPDNADSTASGFYSGKSQSAIITQSEKLSEMMVSGSLSVLGGVSDFVTIRSESDIPGTWGGIYFASESSDNKCVVLNCRISGANCGIICTDSSPELRNVNISGILNYGIGISGSTSNPLVQNLMISKCSRGIYLKDGGVVVKNSIITGSAASGIVVESSSFSLFENSIFSGNSGGIEISDSNSVRIFDSIIGGNRYGVLCADSNSVQIKNNVIVSNSEYGIKADESVQIQYNNVYGNQSSGNTSKVPEGGNYMSVQSGYGDIQVTPDFIKADFTAPDAGDWNLNSGSLMTGAGIDGRNIGLSIPDYTGIQQKVFFND
jgi:parallel beta-helix repeat protein